MFISPNILLNYTGIIYMICSVYVYIMNFFTIRKNTKADYLLILLTPDIIKRPKFILICCPSETRETRSKAMSEISPTVFSNY
jgi:hypothetical protein